MTDIVLSTVCCLQPDLPHAYVCAESYIFDVTEWFSCQVIQIILVENLDLFVNICMKHVLVLPKWARPSVLVCCWK